MFKFYTGLTLEHFDQLFGVSERVGKVNEIKYWKGKKTKSPRKKTNSKQCSKLIVKNQLMLMLMKLRQHFANHDLAYTFDINLSKVSSIINAWIQYLYEATASLRKRMFPSKELIKRHLPALFRSLKKTRIIIDCSEIPI